MMLLKARQFGESDLGETPPEPPRWHWRRRSSPRWPPPATVEYNCKQRLLQPNFDWSIERKEKNLLLPNLDGLLRGLLGGAVGLQGLDDRELPRVPSPVLVQSTMVKRWWRNNCFVFYLENSFPADADPCPGLRHLVQLLLKDGKLWLRLISNFWWEGFVAGVESIS